MRIALVSSSSGSRGGGELYLCGLAEGLTKLGSKVHSIVSSHPRMDELAGRLEQFGQISRIDFLNTYDRPLRCVAAIADRQSIRRLRRQLTSLPVDIIHINKQNIEDGLDILLAAEQSKIPAVSTIHVTRSMRSLNSSASHLRDFVAGWTLRSTSLPLIAVAQAGLTDLESIGLNPNRLHLVWNGVAQPQDSDRDKLRSNWGCTKDHFVLGCIARIETQKNPLFLVDILARTTENVRLVWIGDGSLRQEMQNKAHKLGVAHRLVMPGWQSDARVSMKGFDVFVLPSLYEGLPLAILEAMASELPCLVSDVDGVAEAVIEQETGFVCRPGDISSWLERIQFCIEHPEWLNSAGHAGYQRYKRYFSLEAMAQRTLNVYSTAIMNFAKQPTN